MPAINRITRRDFITLLIVLFAAALMRIGEPGIVEFKHDEAWLSLKAQDMAAGREFPLTGILSSVGIPNPPVSVYVMALPYRFSSNPVVATLFIATLNIIGVGTLWLIAYRYFNRTVALAAGLAYALNPWAVLFSRKIWAQDFHTPFLLIAILLGLIGFIEGKRWAQILCLPVLIFALQIHFAAWALLPLYAVLLWLGRRRIAWWALLLSVIFAGLALIPYGIGLSQTLQQDPNRITNALSASEGERTFSAEAITTAAQFATGLGLETQIAPDDSHELLASVPPQPQLWVILGLLTLAGVIFIWQRSYRLYVPLLFAWALLPLIVFSLTWTQVFPHYFIASLPVFALLLGISIDWLVVTLPGQPVSRTVVLSGLLVILLSQAIWWRGLMRYIDTQPSLTEFGRPVGHVLPIRTALQPFNDVLLLTGDSRLQYSQEPARWKSMLYSPTRCVRALGNENLAIFPAHPFAVLVGANVQTTRELYMTDSPQIFTLPSGEEDYILHTLAAAPPLPEPLVQLRSPARFDNRVYLTGYKIDENRVSLGWSLPGEQMTNYQYFIHLLDVIGERIAQQDGPFLEGRYWCAGDNLLTWAEMEIPEAARVLRVGMYRLEGDQFINSNLLDAEGNPVGIWTDIPLG